MYAIIYYYYVYLEITLSLKISITSLLKKPKPNIKASCLRIPGLIRVFFGLFLTV